MPFPLQPLTEVANGVIDINGNYYPFLIDITNGSLPVASNIRYYIRDVHVNGTTTAGGGSDLSISYTMQGISFVLSLVNVGPSSTIAGKFDLHALMDSSTAVTVRSTGYWSNLAYVTIFAAVDLRGVLQ